MLQGMPGGSLDPSQWTAGGYRFLRSQWQHEVSHLSRRGPRRHDGRYRSRDRICPSCSTSLSLSWSRGRRESRAPDAPAAWGATKTSPPVSPLQVQPVTPAFPAQWFDGFLRALPGERRFLSPLPCQHGPAGIDATVAAPGPHDFAVRCQRFRPASKPARRQPRPSQPAPRLETTAKRPSEGAG
jgi:hypothetical protein